MLQVFDHLSMQCSQFLSNTKQPDHPSHKLMSHPPGTRPDRKPTLQHRFNPVVEPYTDNSVIMSVSHKRAVASIHTNTVSEAMAKREPNRVLGVHPPPQSPSLRGFLASSHKDHTKTASFQPLQGVELVQKQDKQCSLRNLSWVSAFPSFSDTLLFLFGGYNSSDAVRHVGSAPRSGGVLVLPPPFSHLPPLVPPRPRPLPEPPPPGGRG
jgi:hypothetical protein